MQRGSAASSSRGSKFSALRNLPAADTVATAATTLPARRVRVTESDQRKSNNNSNIRISGSGAHEAETNATSSTVRRVQDKERAAEDDDETEERIQRHRYAQLVARLVAQRNECYSTGVFVEAMLTEAQHAAHSSLATQAAVATWGLRILARESRSAALTAVMHALLPALYCQYDPGEACTASPAVQLQVRDPDVIADNPYFTHAMYVDAAQSGKQSTLELRQALEAAVKANDERRNVVLRLLERGRQARVATVFRGWRNQVRQNRIVKLISENHAKRETQETAQLRKQAVFYQWKLLVERARSTYLTERLHDAAFQLENAKNQFQLQCYRADRLVQAAKDATDELARVTQINTELSAEVAELKAERVEREKEFNRLLTSSVSRLLRLLGTYDELTRVFVKSKQTVATEKSTAVGGGGGGGAVGSPNSPDAAMLSVGKAGAEGSLAVSRLSPSEKSLKVAEEKMAAATSSSDLPLAQLRSWANNVLAGVQGRETPFRPIRTLGPDFADGERYLCLLQHVFPDVVSNVLSVRTMGVETRLRRIRDYAAQCKLRYVLLPSDFLNEREDLLVCSLSELRQRQIARRWKESALLTAAELDEFRETTLTATVEACTDRPPTLAPDTHDTPAAASSTETNSLGSEGEGEEGEDSGEPLLDSAAVVDHIADFVHRLQSTQQELEAALNAEVDVVDSCLVIAEEEARLGSERLHGAPIPLVEEVHRRAFWQVAPAALSDLREEPRLSAEAGMWDFTMSQSLPAVLRDGVDVVSRLFFTFAGENAKALSEVAFWRFVESSGILVSPLEVPKQWIVTQYDRVVSPQLDAALSTAARNQSEMSVQKLREVAYQEMDIRTAAPIQFVELLVRIAVAAENGEFGLVEGTRRLLQRLQLPAADKLTAVERDLATPETQNVLRYFNEDLFRTFLFYVKQQESSRNAQERAMALQDGGRFSAQMSTMTLFSILDDCRYLSDGNERGTAAALTADSARPRFFISTAQIRKLVPALERQRRVPPSGYLSFGLFVDLLATLAYHWCPDPLVPAARRFAAFLSFTMQQLNARHINSTLLLGNAPTISLEGGKAVDFSQEARPMSGSR